ncbi:MAG TPA: phenylalanine--tRNA ligase subunit alpha [Firmicutes bacterium]|nr:phenylalanine--tRNA ligase subunit alpha [Candidatus Fermentithermobacillaceae bacterium]
MENQVEKLGERALKEIEEATSLAALEEVRLKYLGKKGEVTGLLKTIGSLPKEERPAFGAKVNALREAIEGHLKEKTAFLERKALEERVKRETVDVTLPGNVPQVGSLHPLTKALREIVQIFYGMGFTVYESREAETDEMNFVKLNLAPGHPSRDAQETLYLTETTLLRTHTSPGQIRGMLDMKGKLPVRFIVPGRVYRRDQMDASHSPVFHQVEGLVIDRHITFEHLKGCFLEFARGFFGPETKIRLRPSYFPFTEPSAEIDVSCTICKGKGCPVCGRTGWLELSGAGMVHPNVIRNGGYDPDEVTGFAFGFGLDRAAMLKWGIDDLRVLFENDLRFLRQFEGI